MDTKKTEAKVREIFVHDLTKPKTFTLKGEAGFKIKSLKQKVGEVASLIGEDVTPCAENTITATATTFMLATKIDELQVVIPTPGKWMLTYPDTFEFEADESGVADFKVIIDRQPQERQRRPRINRDGQSSERTYRPRDSRPYRQSDELSSLHLVSGKDFPKEK